jgi:hypothetical protein
MTDETPNGVLLKSADGSHYFIPAADLSQYAAPHVPEDKSDEVTSTAERLDAYSIDASNSDAAVALGIGI